jgi:tetratricopeptide (TPR) repeat protein
LPDSYWQAGMLTLLQLAFCFFLVFNLEIVFYGPVIKDMGPLKYNESRLSFLVVIYLPTLFSIMLALLARSRVAITDSRRLKAWQKFLFRYTFLLIPAFTLLTGIVMLLGQPPEIRSLIKARIMLESAAPASAIKIADAALEQQNDFAALHFVKGTALLQSDSNDHSSSVALYHLQRANMLAEENAIYLYHLSMAHDIERNQQQAVESASAAVSLQSKDAFLWQHLGELNLKYQRFSEAIDAYQQAVKLEPENAVLLNNLAYTCLEIDKDLPQALEMSRKSVELMPGFIFNSDTLAWAYYKNGMFAQALEVINSIYEGRDEHTAEVDFHYAMILHANGLLAEPLQAMERLLARPEVITDQKLLGQVRQTRDKILQQAPVAEKGEAKDHEENE